MENNDTKWIHITEELPDYNEPVIVWVKYKDRNSFEWTESEMEDPKYRTDLDYVEPYSKHCWSMGSARDYQITHWAKVTPAFL